MTGDAGVSEGTTSKGPAMSQSPAHTLATALRNLASLPEILPAAGKSHTFSTNTRLHSRTPNSRQTRVVVGSVWLCFA
jgi:hypothetical protein